LTSRPTPRDVATASFAIVANGFADGPAQALRDYLVERRARVVAVFHPLSREQGTRHVVTEYVAGKSSRTRSIAVPLRPPLSFAADPVVPLRLPAVDVWFGFNPLACARGLLARRFGRARHVVLWSVDFVPGRFGGGTPLTKLYDRLDRLGCERADARVELSAAAQDARNRHHGLPADLVPTYVVPMGAWVERTPLTSPEGYRASRVVFLGHLVARQGVSALLDATALLRERETDVTVDIVGDGPQLPELKQRSLALGLGEAVRFHGFVPEARDVERILAGASIAVAPYETTETSFSRYADPGKLKSYLAAGLPIVLTDVPPNARELAREAGAELVAYEPGAIADAITHGLASPREWTARREAALEHARRFDWAVLLGGLLERLGFKS
jgi:glycosyltransferase involved in cell wall biosynthesis